MTATPTNDPRSWGEVIKNGYSYSSILSAIERLILMAKPTLPRYYLPNFEGITRALYDLGTILSTSLGGGGTVTTTQGAFVGIYPPNWDPATGTYKPGLAPDDGILWFDLRQGRLFIAISREWYQTNGAESFVHVGPTPPTRTTMGALWSCTLDGRLYLFIDDPLAGGTPGWYEQGHLGVKLLDELLDVDANGAVVPIAASNQLGLLMRDQSVADNQPSAWKKCAVLDEGEYR